MKTWNLKQILAGALVLVTLPTLQGLGAEYYLRADATTVMLPDGSSTLMWGFAKDSSFGAMDGVVTVPGPTLTVLPDDPELVIHLDNRLPVPVSIVIPGQTIVPAPVRMVNGRARSFTTETASSNSVPVDYSWTNLRPGTFLYQSGTHPAVQVQMGLYGAVRKDFAYGQTYEGVSFHKEVTLLYSEIDTLLHDAIATGNYGPGQTVTSTVWYEPKYFLINGLAYTNGLAPIPAGHPGETVVLHFLNAGLATHVPIVNNAYLRLIAEDGFPYPYPKEQYSVFLAAGKTIDALFTFETNSVLAVYDRRLDMMNSNTSSGGMLTYLSISQPSCPIDIPADWVLSSFGPAPELGYPPNTVGALDDPDHDGMSNLAEYISGTSPTNASSFLRIKALSPPDPLAGTAITYGDTVAGRNYNVLSSTNLVSNEWSMIITNTPGYPGVMHFTDPRPLVPNRFYRISVACP
jgi:FtsP/CotA-like multicopper oxidase with cupredoxin domain